MSSRVINIRGRVIVIIFNPNRLAYKEDKSRLHKRREKTRIFLFIKSLT